MAAIYYVCRICHLTTTALLSTFPSTLDDYRSSRCLISSLFSRPKRGGRGPSFGRPISEVQPDRPFQSKPSIVEQRKVEKPTKSSEAVAAPSEESSWGGVGRFFEALGGGKPAEIEREISSRQASSAFLGVGGSTTPQKKPPVPPPQKKDVVPKETTRREVPPLKEVGPPPTTTAMGAGVGLTPREAEAGAGLALTPGSRQGSAASTAGGLPLTTRSRQGGLAVGSRDMSKRSMSVASTPGRQGSRMIPSPRPTTLTRKT